MKFAWHREKAESNLKKHGVSFEEASTVFGDPLSLIIHDPMHSDHEDRFILSGMSSGMRFLVVCHVCHDEKHVRIISARIATKQERGNYESRT
jgi:uncharacterized DUF497 family protein